MNAYHGLMSAAELQAVRAATAAMGVYGSLAEDVHQEAALRYWRSGATGSSAAYTLARRAAIDILRGSLGRRGQRQCIELGPEHDRPSGDDPESHARAMQALRRLPRGEAVLAEVLATTDDGQEAARVLGVTPGRISQRREPLRAALARFVG